MVGDEGRGMLENSREEHAPREDLGGKGRAQEWGIGEGNLTPEAEMPVSEGRADPVL